MDDVVSIVEQLDLEPGTCGFMGPTYVGAHGAALYFLITLDRPGHVHQLDADQVYHHYDGAPLDVVFLTAAGPQLHTLGHFGDEGCVPQPIVPAGTVHGSRTRGPYTLACTTSFSAERPEATAATTEELAAVGALGFS